MSVGKFIEDGSSLWYQMPVDGSSISVEGDLGGGAITLEQQIEGATYPVRDGTDAISISAASADFYQIGGMIVRLTLTGATNPVVAWAINSPRLLTHQ